MRSRLALSLLTLLQLGLAIAAASQVRDLIDYGTEILPRAVLLVLAVLASAIVAARATFGRPESLTSRTALFIVCQLVSMVTILVLLFGPGPSGLALPFTPLPPNEIFGSQWALATISYALLLTIPVAVSTLAVAGWHLYVHAPASGASVIPRSLGFWVLGAVCAVALVTGVYTWRFNAAQDPLVWVPGLFEPGSRTTERYRRLVAMPLKDRQRLRPVVLDGLTRPEACSQAFAAYVLIAAGIDDGSGMTRLRAILRTPDADCAVRLLVRGGAGGPGDSLGAAGAPALPELIELLKRPATSGDEEMFVSRVALAVGGIGPAAAQAVPWLLGHASARSEYLRGNAADAIDRIDPAFAARCVANVTSMVEAARSPVLTLRPECLPPGDAGR